MNELSNDERNLLRHYAEGDRLISRSQRAPVHQHLLRIGFIEEKPVSRGRPLFESSIFGAKASEVSFQFLVGHGASLVGRLLSKPQNGRRLCDVPERVNKNARSRFAARLAKAFCLRPYCSELGLHELALSAEGVLKILRVAKFMN
jgi:hypothetical protein